MTALTSELELTASICMDSFEEFCKEFWECIPGTGQTELIWGWHMSLMCRELQEIAELVFANQPRKHDAAINVPPGTSKSSICSVLFPCWVWTRMPEARFICASHTAELVMDLANKSRDVIRSAKFQACFPWLTLKHDHDAKGYYGNSQGGSRLACTVGGKTPTGFHAHFIIVDDPIDPQGAMSELELKSAAHFMTNVIPTRKVDKEVTVTILIMQRLHRQDPTAIMLEIAQKSEAFPVRHICLPGEIKESWDVQPPELRSLYSPEGLMDPNRLTWPVLRDLLIRLGPYGYSGQIGQSPTPAGGGMFKEVYFNQRIKAAPYHAKRIRYWDRACLVGSTLIKTVAGMQSIEHIKAGDLVLTRDGYRPVKWAGLTKLADTLCELRDHEGRVLLTATPEHKIWVMGKGWTELFMVRPKDRLLNASGPTGPSESFYVRRQRLLHKVPVFDIEIDCSGMLVVTRPEFFANGYLVHNSTQDGGCATAGVLMSKDKDGNVYVEDCVWGQWEPSERNQIMRATAMRDRGRYGPNNEPEIWVEAEGGSAGRDAWKGVVKSLEGFLVREDRVTGDKDRRAEPWSSQCAALNVYLVDNGHSVGTGEAKWDVSGYVEEHVLFKPEQGKRGRFKDRVDASSGAYNLLLGKANIAGTFRVLSAGPVKPKGFRIFVLHQDELGRHVDHDPALLVYFSESRAAFEDMEIPAHGLNNLLGTLTLNFQDLAPSELQQDWLDKPELESHIMKPEEGKKLWAFLLKKRDPQARSYVLVDSTEDSRRAISCAAAIADSRRMARNETVWQLGDSDYIAGDCTRLNPHVFEVVKASRMLVVG